MSKVFSNFLERAKDYYCSARDGAFDVMKSYMSRDACFIGPLTVMKSDDEIIENIKEFGLFFKDIAVRESFVSENKVVLILENEDPLITDIEKFRGVLLLAFNESNLINRVEFFYDTRPFFTTGLE